MAITKVTSGLISADASSIDLNIDAGTLYLDVSENRVGIGTTSPTTSLHVANAGNSFLTLERTGTTGGTGTFAINMEGGSSQQTTMAYDDGGKLVIGRSSDPATQAGFSNDFVLDSSGNVGIGTSSPYKSLTVGDSDASAWITSGGSNTHLTLSANGVSGAVIFRTGGTNGDPSSTSERMRIASNGEILIGDTARRGTNWRGQLQVTQIDATNAAGISCISGNDEIAGTFSLYSSSTNSAAVSIDPDNLRSSSNFYVIIDNIQRANFDASGNLTITGSYSSSDRTKKENIVTLPSQLETVKQLNPVSFDWIERAEDGSTKSSLGFIAQEVEELYPDLVHTPEADPDMPSKDTTKHLNYAVMTAILTKAIQEQQTIIDDLKTRIETLENA